jgi:hypothetical protein
MMKLFLTTVLAFVAMSAVIADSTQRELQRMMMDMEG